MTRDVFRLTTGQRSDLDDVDGLGALGALGDVEGNVVALAQGLETCSLNVAVMNECIDSVLSGDKTIPLGIVKPLYGSVRHVLLLPTMRHRGFARKCAQGGWEVRNAV